MSAVLDPANEPVYDPVALALDVVGQFAAGRFEEAELRFSAQLRAAVSAQAFARQWREELGETQPADCAYGSVSVHRRPDGLVTATVPVRTPAGAMDVLVSMDADGVLRGLRFAPGRPHPRPT